MRKICFVTATRAEYGLLKWIMREVRDSELFVLQIVVTGGHLLEEQGHTIECIKEDGFCIDRIVDVSLDVSTTEKIAASMGRMAEGFANAFTVLEPDYVAVLGDRYELLPIVNTAFVMCIPIIHFSGGDVTEGAIDDGIRNAVTMLASYHFPGTEESASNIIRMRGDNKNIWVVGELGLDSFSQEDLLSRIELAEDLGLDPSHNWCLFTYHAETRESLEHNIDTVKVCMESMASIENLQIVATYANADYGGQVINDYLTKRAERENDILKVIPSLGNRRYLSYMKQVVFVVGNSSSGIVEAPALGVPVVNIGSRQKGRHLCNNIIQTDADPNSIDKAIRKAMSIGHLEPDHYWGDGSASKKVMEIFERELI